MLLCCVYKFVTLSPLNNYEMKCLCTLRRFHLNNNTKLLNFLFIIWQMGERRGTKALELWCRRMVEGYEGVRIDNMTTSWRDGRAFCALIHTFKPELM